MKMQYASKLITPEIAAEMLSRNPSNRGISPANVQKYAADMSDGKWAENGQSITFDIDGDLLDGQHRLRAIIESRTSQKFLIVTNVARGTFDTIDTGKNRSAADVLTLEGFAGDRAKALASACKLDLLLNWDTCRQTTGSASVRNKATNHEVLKHYKATPGLTTSMEFVMSYPHRLRVVAPGWATLILYYMRKHSPEDADTYMNEVLSGEMIGRGDPAFHVREKLDRDRRNLTLKFPAELKACVVARGWYYYERRTFPKHVGNAWKSLQNAFQVFKDGSSGMESQ